MLDIDPLRDGVPPVPAATIVPVRTNNEGELEVFLMQRHRATAFMGGAFVFPGGKLDPSDHALATSARARSLDAERCLAQLGSHETLSPLEAKALFIAALRETFEEAGILVGISSADAKAREEARNALAQGKSFQEILETLNAELDLTRLIPLARWVTPVVEKRRFDARFFLMEVLPTDDLPSPDAHETVSQLWATPRAAIEKHLAGMIDLPPPTLRTLELMPATIAEALHSAKHATPPYVRPVFRPLEPWILALPGDPEHPETEKAIEGATRFTCVNSRWFSGPATK
jgi:8-oxo-dGTP pyrophosphatase MutT (NUDIX family)